MKSTPTQCSELVVSDLESSELESLEPEIAERKFSGLELSDLKGLGPKSQQWLKEVGIHTPKQLAAIGAVRAYTLLQDNCSVKPGMNFLYALVGAVQNRHWGEVAKNDKSQLLSELESHREMQQLFIHNEP